MLTEKEQKESQLKDNIYSLESRVVNSMVLLSTENGKSIQELNEINSIYTNSGFQGYNRFMKRDLHMSKDNHSIAIKTLGKAFDIRNYLYKELDLSTLIFMLFKIHTEDKNITSNTIYSKIELSNKKIVNSNGLKLIENYYKKGFFIMLDSKKDSDYFIISPILIEVFEIFLGKMSVSNENNVESEEVELIIEESINIG